MMVTLTDELAQIAAGVRALLSDANRRPTFAPPELRDAIMAYPEAGGKFLRPAMVVWACRALGGDPAAALQVGLAAELYHTYTLVHDDVIDRDRVRRGRPSVHALLEETGRAQFALPADEAAHYGLSMAILAGDCLQSWAVHLLTILPPTAGAPDVALTLIRRLQGVTGPAIVEGEVRDIQLPFLPVAAISAEDILQVIRTKTSALFAFCGWAGGLLARGTDADPHVQALAAFGALGGIAFQLQDDILGLTASTVKLGKPVGNDLREGKRTMIIALGWERASDAERATLTRALGNPCATPEEVAAATAVLQHLGAITDVRAQADDYLNRALAHLEALPESTGQSLLRELALAMVQREK